MLKSGAKVIAVCSAGINSDYNDSLWGAFHSLANLFDFKILFFNSFSDLYSYEKHDIGESNIFQLMNYEILDGVIILSETIKYKKVCYDIIEKANAYNIPVVSMDATLDGCYSVNFEYAHAMEEIIEHLINVHHYTKINFIAGIKGNLYSEERLETYRRVLERHNISVDLITTSEVSVALTLDTTGSTSTGDTLLTQSLLMELSALCRVEVEEGLALVALIGNDLSKACGVGKEVFGVLEPFNIRMICYGASSHNLCFLVPGEDAEQVVQKLHSNLFE